jgi:aminopeptidase N
MFKKIFGIIFVWALAAGSVSAQYVRSDSGGVLMPEQAAYDVKSYDLDLRIDIQNRSIKGALTVKAGIVKPIDKFVLDLDTPFTVESVTQISPLKDGKDQPLQFERRQGKIWISFTRKQNAGETVDIRVAYSGKPHAAVNAPWDGGFIWKKTPDGRPWVAVACETEGADLWFPVKDHPSDEPDTASLHFTVPADLYAAGNGRLRSVTDNPDGTKTFNWFVSQPINNYNITLAIAPYKIVEDTVASVTGETVPIQFFVLPQNFEKGKTLVALLKKYFKFFEEYLGPFPFRADKIGVVETPHLGMEHQTLIAYGNSFRYDKNGHDWLLFHEFGHEWWGNLVTAPDWNDFWIHEGFESFMDVLYIEKKQGKAAYFAEMKKSNENILNVRAVAPREPRSQIEMSYIAPAYAEDDSDVYDKGARILHALRFYLGDDMFFKALRRMAYPNAEAEKISNGKQTRFASTDDFLKLVNGISNQDMAWFFEVYLRQPKLPTLISYVKGNQLVLRWEAPNNLPFPMPVEVKIGGETKRVEMSKGTTTITIANGAKYEVDPNGWLLRTL